MTRTCSINNINIRPPPDDQGEPILKGFRDALIFLLQLVSAAVEPCCWSTIYFLNYPVLLL